ncbi:MAG: hypothetical protein IAG13_27850, partial [Deltaproteobacteria bacterium]|nr:hypothetical protein [Nannocystaceae bacterium]
FPALDLTIDTGVVPRCAMSVWRDEESGPLYSLQPEQACGCYYDFRATGSSACTECENDEQCPSETPACNYGFCEVM